MTIVPKDWGHEEVLVNGPLCAKFLHLRPGWRCSEHYHKLKKETFVVMDGWCIISIDGRPRKYLRGEQLHIPAGTPHWFGIPGDTRDEPCVLLEVSTHHDDADVVRLRLSEPYRHSTTDLFERVAACES